MKKILPIAFLLFALSCKNEDVTPKPIADFSALEAANGEVITTNKSKNATRYQWDFGNGQVSTGENPRPFYSQNGSYTIALTAKNDQGDQDIIKNNITITGIPTRGDIMFWTSANVGSSIAIGINYAGTTTGVITKYQTSGTPSDCNVDGFFTMSLPGGTYTFTAKSSKFTWSGSFTVVNGSCSKKELTI